MKYVNRLEIGDWIFEKTNDGRVTIGEVKEIVIDEFTKFNAKGDKIIFDGRGVINTKGIIRVMNPKEINRFRHLKRKLKILNNLEEKPLAKEKY